MSAEISPELRAARSRAGKLGTASRWGPRRIIDLRTVDPAVANVIRAIVAASDNAAMQKAVAVSDDASDGRAEVQRGSAERSAS